MALEYVLMWKREKGWQPISVKEASELCRGGSVLAKSGIFMCGKCHKYVYFSDGKKRGRYFGHSRGDEDKECEDRSHYYDDSYNALDDPQYSLKITYTKSRFSFAVGLTLCLDGLAEGTFKIVPSEGSPFVYNFSRFGGSIFKYFEIGETLAPEYEIVTGDIKISTFPHKVIGMTDNFAIFKAESGKRLPEWANIQVKTEYLLLCKEQFIGYNSSSLTRRFVLAKNGYYLFSVTANRFDESARDYFYKLRCILTTQNPEIYPVWPVYRRTPSIVYHNTDKLFVLLRGENVKPRIFPNRRIECDNLKDCNSVLASFMCYEKDRQQILALDKNNPRLKRMTMWKGDSERTVNIPNIVITDIKGDEITDTVNYELPYKNEMRVKAEFNGFVLKFKNNVLCEKREIKAFEISSFYDVKLGDKFEIYQGLDKIKTVEFVQKAIISNFDEVSFVEALSKCSGKTIAIPYYKLTGAFSRLKRYPKIQKWIRETIRNGCISEYAMKLLRKLVLTSGVKND